MGFGLLGGADDFRIGRVGPADQDIVADRAMKQAGILRHHADPATQALLPDIPYILPADHHAALFDIVESEQ